MIDLINECAESHMSKHSEVSAQRVFISHEKAVTTDAKRTLITIGYDRCEKEELLKKTWEKLGKNVTLCPSINFCRNRESTVFPCFVLIRGLRSSSAGEQHLTAFKTLLTVWQDTENPSADSISKTRNTKTVEHHEARKGRHYKF